jgi:hypothetical protein
LRGAKDGEKKEDGGDRAGDWSGTDGERSRSGSPVRRISIEDQHVERKKYHADEPVADFHKDKEENAKGAKGGGKGQKGKGKGKQWMRNWRPWPRRDKGKGKGKGKGGKGKETKGAGGK